MRIAVALWLTAVTAAAFDASTILRAKLHADMRAGFPCSIQGVVTMPIGRTEFYLQDESSGVRVTSEPYELRAGQRLEVEGWMYLAGSGEFQLSAKKVSLLADEPPPRPLLITLSDAIAGGYQGRLIAVRGTVLNVDFGEEFDSISIRSERSSLRVFHPSNRHGRSVFEAVYPGMEVALTGISVPQTVAPEFDGYQLRLRGPADLAVRRKQAEARPPPVEWAGSLATVMLIGAAAWVWSGRGRRAPPPSQVQ